MTARQFVEKRLSILQLRQAELAGGEIGVGKAKTAVVDVNRAEIIRAFRFEQIELAHRSRADDLGDVARNNFARLRLARLIADRDAPSGLDQLGNITWRRVIRHAAHRHLVPLGQRDIEQAPTLPSRPRKTVRKNRPAEKASSVSAGMLFRSR